MTEKDYWLTTAISDTTVVAELLLRLQQAQAALPSKTSTVMTLKWGLRLPRSRPPSTTTTATTTVTCNVLSIKKESDCSTRCSPTTPFSWSGGGGGVASPSPTADGFDEASCHVTASLSGVRSKGVVATEATSTITKRSRRKKTFAELKEEESSLLKENIYLNKQLETLRTAIKEQRTRNDNFKRLKADLDSSQETVKATQVQLPWTEASSAKDVLSTSVSQSTDGSHPRLPSSEKLVDSKNDKFLLPDLNMIPFEEDAGTEAVCRMR